MRITKSAFRRYHMKPFRTNLSPIKGMVWDRDKLPSGLIICIWCGCAMKKRHFTLEHVKPLSKGGTSEMHNLAAACRKCNNERIVKDD